MKFLWLFFPLAAHAFEIEYADPQDIPYICAAYSKAENSQAKFDVDIGGCYVPTRNRMVIPMGGKYGCIYWHEYRHKVQGDWHKGQKSSDCSWRP